MGMAMGAGQRPIYLEPIPEIRRRLQLYYLTHPRARFAVQIGGPAAVSLAVLASLFSAVHLPPNYVLPVYVAAVTTIALAVTVISLLGLRGRFTGLIPANDPGHYKLPYLPEGADPSKAVIGRFRIPGYLVSGTYPKGIAGDNARRGQFQWQYPPGQKQTFRTLQFKFGAIAVHATGRDAREVRAHAKIRVSHGVLGSVTPHEWCPIGQLNWYFESWEERLWGDEKLVDGVLTYPTLDYVFDSPSLGLNKFLHNPEVTIHRDQGHYLPLYYMREGCSEVFLCAQTQSQIAGQKPR